MSKTKTRPLPLPTVPRPRGMSCPACGGTMVPYGDRYKCANCGALL